ncbi:hypothetical protein [Paenibacillus sp. PAMC21692]|uniref:hypothetical protein n=1 Tax=Paenibacillus sp. PAMC21692 TaxID=2762320 RepID=UPI00164ED1A0|nr:hypothetical protein [Paenibacillus sp. PAMC21692]QNK57302.1 hypothetical protein H7F31_33330 [Paenibacillus sp. PAMC21692]
MNVAEKPNTMRLVWGPPFIGVLGEHFGLLKALYVILACLVVPVLLAGAVNLVGGEKREMKRNA